MAEGTFSHVAPHIEHVMFFFPIIMAIGIKFVYRPQL